MFMSMLTVQSLTNSFGETVIAANIIVARVTIPTLSFRTAMTTYARQNVGIGLYKRVKDGAVQECALAAGISVVIIALLLDFDRFFMGVFTNTSELVELRYQFMSILSVGYIVFSII